MKIEIKKDYRDNKELRDSFNVLAEKVFGLSFEVWYQNGYWKDNYNPYSMIVDGKVVANDNVLEFYPKFGFRIETEYQYSKEISNSEPETVVKVPMNNKQDWDKLKYVIDNSQAFYGFDMVDNSDLDMFYLSQFMKDCVYYVKEIDAYIVAEIDDGEVLIYDIFANKKVDIEDVIRSFGSNVKKAVLGFTPDNKETFDCNVLHEEDTTLFVKGDVFNNFEEMHLMFTPISHA